MQADYHNVSESDGVLQQAIAVKGTKATKLADKSIEHYHVMISDGFDSDMYWSETAPRIKLAPYIIFCSKD